MVQTYDIAIIGAGILGTTIAYFLTPLNRTKNIVLIEQAHTAAFHTSSRNTGKVHGPYLYNPEKKKLFANTAFHGFEMLKTYTKFHDIPFKNDGVIEVALDSKAVKTLEKYRKWGIQNGLQEKDVEVFDKDQFKKIEPNVECEGAICCYRDASTDYGKITRSLMRDSKNNGTKVLMNQKATKITSSGKNWKITLNHNKEIFAKFVINAAGGESIDIAHDMGVGENYTDVHFRGEYWKAPTKYNNLTKRSIYSVPEFPEYPFLDPHWIIRVDGRCEVGPNAVPVFSPYGYERSENIKEFIPKMLEMLSSGARKAIFDRQFQKLAISEIQSSMSKATMVDRVKRFLPKIESDKFTQRGTAGIRSSVIDDKGKFVPDVILGKNANSFHILNYNSPGATGSLPFSAYIVNLLHEDGLLQYEETDAVCGHWRFSEIVEKIAL